MVVQVRPSLLITRHACGDEAGPRSSLKVSLWVWIRPDGGIQNQTQPSEHQTSL